MDFNQNPIKHFLVQSGFDLTTELTPGTYHLSLRAEADEYQSSDDSSSFEFDFIQPTRIILLEAEGLHDDTRMRWIGRTYFNPNDRTKYFYFQLLGLK